MSVKQGYKQLLARYNIYHAQKVICILPYICSSCVQKPKKKYAVFQNPGANTELQIDTT